MGVVPRIQNWFSAGRAAYGKIFSGPSMGRCGDGIARHGAFGSVRLIEPAGRPPPTPVERCVVTLLEKEGVITCDNLVSRVASELYGEELRHGASALDIGLFGSRLFARDVMGELKAADGVLWEIIQGKGAA